MTVALTIITPGLAIMSPCVCAPRFSVRCSWHLHALPGPQHPRNRACLCIAFIRQRFLSWMRPGRSFARFRSECPRLQHGRCRRRTARLKTGGRAELCFWAGVLWLDEPTGAIQQPYRIQIVTSLPGHRWTVDVPQDRQHKPPRIVRVTLMGGSASCRSASLRMTSHRLHLGTRSRSPFRGYGPGQ